MIKNNSAIPINLNSLTRNEYSAFIKVLENGGNPLEMGISGFKKFYAEIVEKANKISPDRVIHGLIQEQYQKRRES